MGKTTGQPLLKNGSKGDDVKKLQQSLINAGYDVGKTGADGILGKNTEAAIKKYQKDNGLAVDGIAGKNTLGSLYGNDPIVAVDADGNVASPDPKKPVQGTNTGGEAGGETGGETGGPPTFEPTVSDTVVAANQLLQDQMNSMPGAYQSQWQSQINDYMSKIENRDPFSYNFNEDALYQMFKDQYIQQGQMAMMDTMGQAAAMTGGYGNSYAQTVGQQAYNQQLSQLNNIIPDLYQMAYNRYRDEGQDLLNMYNMYMDRENMDYGRHQDALNNWWKQTEYLTGRADTEYERDYNSQWDSYTAENDNYWKEYSANYQEGRDAIEDQKDQRDWIAGMISAGFEPSDEDLAAAGMTRAEADALKNAYTTSATKGDDPADDGPASWHNGDLAEYQVEILQEELGITIDGKWGKDSFRAAGNMTADDAWKAYLRGELKAPNKDGDQKEANPYTMSDAAKNFMSHLPYAHAGSSAETWKVVVAERLIAQYNNDVISDEDCKAIMYELGIEAEVEQLLKK